MIIRGPQARYMSKFQPFLRFWLYSFKGYDGDKEERVSTLLEILGFVCSVLVGF